MPGAWRKLPYGVSESTIPRELAAASQMSPPLQQAGDRGEVAPGQWDVPAAKPEDGSDVGSRKSEVVSGGLAVEETGSVVRTLQ